MNRKVLNFVAVLFACVSLNPCLAEDAVDESKPVKAAKQVDRLDLDTSSIKGNQELPKVLYIVPWKQAGIGDLTGKPVNSLLDEVLTPLDREVFRRQVHYFDQLYVAEQPAAEQK